MNLIVITKYWRAEKINFSSHFLYAQGILKYYNIKSIEETYRKCTNKLDTVLLLPCHIKLELHMTTHLVF